jgi:hypothetical protein
MNEPKPKGRPKLSEIQIEADDLDAVLEMSIKSIKMGRPTKFSEDAQGLNDFKQASIDYLEYVRKVNDNPENENRLIPDIESWATFLGTTRATILTYEKQRGEEWREFIALIKGAITAAKKQLAFRQKIPTVLALFDLTNNSGYVNSNQFTLTTEQDERREVIASDLPQLGQQRTAQLPVIDTAAEDGN